MFKLEDLAKEQEPKYAGSNVFLVEVMVTFAKKGDKYHTHTDHCQIWLKNIEDTTEVDQAMIDQIAAENAKAASDDEYTRSYISYNRGDIPNDDHYVHTEDNVGFSFSAFGDWPHGDGCGYTNGFDLDFDQIGTEVVEEQLPVLAAMAEKFRYKEHNTATFISIWEYKSSSTHDYWTGECDYESWLEIVGFLDLNSGAWSKHNAPGVSKNPAERSFVMRLGV
jgi:hypothetical protein